MLSTVRKVYSMTDKTTLITKEDVAYVAKLAHLRFSEEEALDCQEKLASILAYMQELQKIDTTGVELTTHPLNLTNVFREDVVGECLPREAALANAPDRTEDSFKVPKIL